MFRAGTWEGRYDRARGSRASDSTWDRGMVCGWQTHPDSEGDFATGLGKHLGDGPPESLPCTHESGQEIEPQHV